eukprot:1040896_1
MGCFNCLGRCFMKWVLGMACIYSVAYLVHTTTYNQYTVRFQKFFTDRLPKDLLARLAKITSTEVQNSDKHDDNAINEHDEGVIKDEEQKSSLKEGRIQDVRLAMVLAFPLGDWLWDLFTFENIDIPINTDAAIFQITTLLGESSHTNSSRRT